MKLLEKLCRKAYQAEPGSGSPDMLVWYHGVEMPAWQTRERVVLTVVSGFIRPSLVTRFLAVEVGEGI